VPVQQLFFDKLGVLFEQLVTYQVPIYIAGDFNNRTLDRPDDPHFVQFRHLIDCYGLMLHHTDTTHQCGGTLDAVLTRDDVGRPECVDVIDVGLSDHHLLQWSVDITRPVTPAVVDRCRPWRQLDIEQLQSMLSSSTLCQPDIWPTGIDAMAAVYNDELNSTLEQLIPPRPISHRPRPSDPWFDAECRAAKRLTPWLERAYAAARRRHTTTTTSILSDGNSAIHPVTPIVADRHDNDATAVAAARRAWYDQRRAYHLLHHQKCSAFWAQKVESERAEPAKLWRSVDQLL